MFQRKTGGGLTGGGLTGSGEAARQVGAGDIHGRRSGLALFFAVTFATTWAFWLIAIALGGSPTSSPAAVPFLLGGFGPVFGAIAVRVRRARRRAPVPARTVKFRQGVRLFWALPLLALTSASVVAGALLADVLGGPGVSLTEGRELISSVGGIVPFFVSMLIGGPLSEEPGWRGTAYPRLRASMSRLQAGLLLGAVWAVWHLPLFFIEGTVQAELGLISWSGLMFSLSVIPVTLLTGYAYERAGVVASIAVHLGFNATMAVLTVDSPVTQASVLAVQIVLAIILLATQHDRRTAPPLVQAEAALHPHQALTEHQALTDASHQISPTRG